MTKKEKKEEVIGYQIVKPRLVLENDGSILSVASGDEMNDRTVFSVFILNIDSWHITADMNVHLITNAGKEYTIYTSNNKAEMLRVHKELTEICNVRA